LNWGAGHCLIATWQATYFKQPFPVMVGKLKLARASAGVTRLTVRATYELPVRPAEKVDHAFMELAAEAAVKELATSISKRLAADVLRRAGNALWGSALPTPRDLQSPRPKSRA
jgi:hypothetical protein